MSETALAVIPQETEKGAKALMQVANDAASVCREIVLRTVLDLKGKRYVKVEGWQSIAAVYGCVPNIRLVQEDERGNVKAVAELRRHDGTVLASAEGYVGVDEVRWASEPMFARRGMAQTRAVSRVCRSVFAFVVTLIDSNLQTTPAEEIPLADNSDVPVARIVHVPASAAANATQRQVGERTKRTQCKYGRAKGKYLCDIEDADLVWQLAAATKSVEANDPTWHQQNCAWLDAVREETARRGK